MVAGNPVITRLEDSVANCFPGLELDVRNLDRRFFPGLVFEFIENGARLAYIELYQDPDLTLEEKKDAASRLYKQLSKFQAKIDKDESDAMEKAKEHSIDPETIDLGSWFLDSIKENGKTIKVGKFDDVTVWRIVRGLEVDTVVEVGLRKYKDRAGSEPLSTTVKLKGWRRRFTDKETGVINGAYQPGELTQGLCSPWQHDFRDCACFYWAANHPDIVLGELDPGEAQADKTSASDPIVPLDWLRRDRARRREAEAFETIDENRPHQLDHFEINRVWQDLNIVVEGREIGGLYVPATIDTANPFASPGELAEKLAGTLAPLEVALTFEYLYARLSMRSEDEVPPGNAMLRGAVALARNNLLLIASSEMLHLRWVNQILRELYDRKLIPDKDFTQPRFAPVLVPAKRIPRSTTMSIMRSPPEDTEQRKQVRPVFVNQFIIAERAAGTQPDSKSSLRPIRQHGLDDFRDAKLRPLTPLVIDDFIAVEHPSAFIDGAYASVITTLREPEYPAHLVEIALRIAADGLQHEKRFREIKSALDFPPGKELSYLRAGFSEGTHDQAAEAREPLAAIKRNLRDAYVAADENHFTRSAELVTKARDAMTRLRGVSERLAKEKNIGVPFFSMWNELP